MAVVEPPGGGGGVGCRGVSVLGGVHRGGGGDEGGGGSGPGHCGPRLHNSLLGLHIGRRFGQLLWPGIGCFISTGDLNT